MALISHSVSIVILRVRKVEGLGWMIHLSFTWYQVGQLGLMVHFQDGFFIDISGTLCSLPSLPVHMVPRYPVPLTTCDRYISWHGRLRVAGLLTWQLELPPEQIFQKWVLRGSNGSFRVFYHLTLEVSKHTSFFKNTLLMYPNDQ